MITIHNKVPVIQMSLNRTCTHLFFLPLRLTFVTVTDNHFLLWHRRRRRGWRRCRDRRRYRGRLFGEDRSRRQHHSPQQGQPH